MDALLLWVFQHFVLYMGAAYFI